MNKDYKYNGYYLAVGSHFGDGICGTEEIVSGGILYNICKKQCKVDEFREDARYTSICIQKYSTNFESYLSPDEVWRCEEIGLIKIIYFGELKKFKDLSEEKKKLIPSYWRSGMNPESLVVETRKQKRVKTSFDIESTVIVPQTEVVNEEEVLCDFVEVLSQEDLDKIQFINFEGESLEEDKHIEI